MTAFHKLVNSCKGLPTRAFAAGIDRCGGRVLVARPKMWQGGVALTPADGKTVRVGEEKRTNCAT